ncbi:divalent-cation tolerance protein CutA [Methylococcus sp. EFPC2]|uniref:divalent-cation tolerance protein CutA n=1 Tax=Methylococcus sp. EFPC2 TaxID=2812648 RepID=UPI0019682889|nr:divalent-cation tolerance protein CutA [Methylococcus sp. EFPC2]QSA96993.1 divalent-cation tolerance protein CutA [Methylococcus sp. EFPC2]
MTTPYCLVLCTCPEGDVATSLARFLVEEGLAACVNLLPGVDSIYRWEGELETARECLLLIKTERSRYPELETRLRQAHPYQIPEIIALPLERGLTDYLHWISSCLCSRTPG